MSERVKKKNELLGLPTPSSFIMSGRSFRLDRQPHPVPARVEGGGGGGSSKGAAAVRLGREVERKTRPNVKPAMTDGFSSLWCCRAAILSLITCFGLLLLLLLLLGG